MKSTEQSIEDPFWDAPSYSRTRFVSHLPVTERIDRSRLETIFDSFVPEPEPDGEPVVESESETILFFSAEREGQTWIFKVNGPFLALTGAIALLTFVLGVGGFLWGHQ